MGLIIRIVLLLLSSVTMCETLYASWTVPTEVLSGTWGNNPGQFGIKHEDTDDSFPRIFCVSILGVLAVADEFNSRVQTYKADGSLIASFGPQSIPEAEGWKLDWPLRIGCLSNGVYTEFDKYTQIYENGGALVKSWDNLNGGLVDILSNDNFISKTASAYYLYSPTGELLQTYSERPLELGRVTDKKLAPKQYKVTVTYPDKIWGTVGKGAFPKYMRDTRGNLYGVGETEVARLNDCGREISRVSMPSNDIEEIPRMQEGAEPIIAVGEEYGSPVLAPNGDVYTWKRTPDKYSIVKWTWQDDPNVPANVPDAPTDLKVTPSTTSLALTWKLSFQDPGCVTGYEILRSTTSGAGFSTVVTVDKSVLKYEDTTAEAGATYYYKVRASGGDGFSEYSNEASGKR